MISSTEQEAEMKSSNHLQTEGGWGWAVVMGSHFIQAFTSGEASCMGLFLLEWLHEFQTPVSTSSWIVSLVPILTGILSEHHYTIFY